MQSKVNSRCSFKEMASVSSLKENPRNRNVHSPEQIERLAKVIEYQGFRHPIIVSNRSGLIAAGHGRLSAAKKLGLETVPVDYQDFDSEESEYAFLVSDNAIAAWAELDLSGINIDLSEIGPFDIDLLGLKGFGVDPAEREKKPKEPKAHECPSCGHEWREGEE